MIWPPKHECPQRIRVSRPSLDDAREKHTSDLLVGQAVDLGDGLKRAEMKIVFKESGPMAESLELQGISAGVI